MSEAQLAKLTAERDALKHELSMIQSAIPPPKACLLLRESMANKPDPLLYNHPGGSGPTQEPNEWITENNGESRCCGCM